MTTQTVTAQELITERPEMVESIIDLIIADSIATLVETDDPYSHLLRLFIRPGEDIVENYKSAKQGIDLSTEYQALIPFVEQLIDNIGSDLFTDMLDTDDNAAHSEVLRCFGHGVSFWDDHYYEDFGFSETPRLKTTLEQPYNVASQILDKINEAYLEDYSSVIESWTGIIAEDEEETEDNEFDKWLTENYSPAGEDASNGEQWFLSNSPHEFMPIFLSKLREQWEKENYIQELPGSELLDGRIFEDLSEKESKELENKLAERGVLHLYQ